MKAFYAFLFSLFPISLFSQNVILGGSLMAQQIGDCDSKIVEATLVIYAQGSVPPQTFQINWGDSTFEPFEFQSGEPIENEVARYIAILRHTYSGSGTFSISAEACCLLENLVNLDGSGLSFLPQAEMVISENDLQGCDSHPQALMPSMGLVYSGQNLTFNPAFFDPDGDSLSYSFRVPPVGSNYRFPDEVEPGPGNQLNLDATTGDLNWEAPQKPGDYFLLLEIDQFRSQLPRGKTEFWMTVRVKENGLLLYPNPTLGDLIVELENGGDKELSIRIFNPLGQLVREEKGMFDWGRFPLKINGLRAGGYLFEIESGDEKWVRRVVKI